jgi:hypothetical protein
MKPGFKFPLPVDYPIKLIEKARGTISNLSNIELPVNLLHIHLIGDFQHRHLLLIVNTETLYQFNFTKAKILPT